MKREREREKCQIIGMEYCYLLNKETSRQTKRAMKSNNKTKRKINKMNGTIGKKEVITKGRDWLEAIDCVIVVVVVTVLW